MYYWLPDGTMVPFEETVSAFGDTDGQELEAMPSNPMFSAQDYIARARYLAGAQDSEADNNDGVSSAVDARRVIAKLERATTELRQGLLGTLLSIVTKMSSHVFLFLGDDDFERKTQAEILLNAYSRELDRRRLAAGSQGLLIRSDGMDLSIDSE